MKFNNVREANVFWQPLPPTSTSHPLQSPDHPSPLFFSIPQPFSQHHISLQQLESPPPPCSSQPLHSPYLPQSLNLQNLILKPRPAWTFPLPPVPSPRQTFSTSLTFTTFSTPLTISLTSSLSSLIPEPRLPELLPVFLDLKLPP